MTKDEANRRFRALAEWQGSYVLLVAREPGKPDRVLFASDNETESRAVCYPALKILERRAQNAISNQPGG